MNNPLVSIILRSYNRPVYLKRAIESVMNQTYPNFELILTDDCSTDPKINDLMCEWSKKDNRFKAIFHNKNSGFVCRGTNDALDIARGEYISFLDDDNFYMENRLEMLVAKELEGDFDLVYSLSFIGDLEGNRHGIHRFGKGAEFSYEQMKKQNFIDSMEYLIKKSVIDDIGYFNETLSTSEDWHFLLRVCHKYKNIGFVNEPLNYYSQHPARRMFHTMDIDKTNVAKIYRDLEKLNRPKRVLIIKSHKEHYTDVEMITLMIASHEGLDTKIIEDSCDIDKELAIFNPDIVTGIMPVTNWLSHPNKPKDCQWVLIDSLSNNFCIDVFLWDWVITCKDIEPEGKKMIYCKDNLNEKKIKKIFQLIEANRSGVGV